MGVRGVPIENIFRRVNFCKVVLRKVNANVYIAPHRLLSPFA